MPPNDTPNQELTTQLWQDFTTLQGARGLFERQWQEISLLVLPPFAGTWFGASGNPGQKNTLQQVDATAPQSLARFVTIILGLIVPQNSRWHTLEAYLSPASDVGYDPNGDREKRLWLENTTNILFHHRYCPDSRFTSQVAGAVQSIGAFGTGILFLESGPNGKGIHYLNVPLREAYLRTDHQGRVDSVFRRFELTARQAIQRWPDKLPKQITEVKEKETRFTFLHCVVPNTNRKKGVVTPEGMPFREWYIAEVEKTVVAEGGFRVFPYAVGRYSQALDEIYGQSPAMVALAAIKTANEMAKTLIKQGQKAVDPVLLAYDDGELPSINLRPGAINIGGVSADGRPLIQALQAGNIVVGEKLLEMVQGVIKDVYLIELFQVLADPRTMSATEVVERSRERALLLAPTIAQLQEEFMGAIITRELDILDRQQALTPPPPSLMSEWGPAIKVRFMSPLSRMQHAEESAGAMRTLETAMAWANATQDPTVMDVFDPDRIIPNIAHINGMRTSDLRSPDDIQKRRKARAEMMQQQQDAAALPGQANMVKSIGNLQKGPQQ